MLLENAQLVVGVDMSAQAIHWAEEHFQGPCFVQGLIEEEPWTGKFETVVSFETIEHISNPKQALEAFRKACIGTFIVSTPNEERYPFRAEKFANDESPHFRHYKPEEFETLLQSCGFKVIEKFCQKDKQGQIYTGTDGMFLIYRCD